MVSKSNHFRGSGVSQKLIEKEINKQTEHEDSSSLDGTTEENDV